MKATKAERSSATKSESKPAGSRRAPTSTPRLSKEAREQQIVQKAIQLFAERGFSASTHEIARALGITQPLLYNYFPTKEALVDRVYDEVFVRKWDPVWEDWLADSTQPLAARLKRYLKDYARFVLKSDWVRIFISAGLTREGINQRYLARLRERHFMVIAREMRAEYGIPEPRNEEELEDEIELIWSMHSSVFYIGVRKWVYALPAPKDLDRVIDMRVDTFLLGAPQVLKQSRPTRATKAKRQGALTDS
ncbi:TetR/AcrR family transcriptional regulator [Paraburkholderia terrae]|uniref:TetR family transcriptional regulator n=1 Tax=Paraburkholderia terrae TaxID=311230 RepID=A0ABM7U367_9BURK|nr:TetR/AcrR family transcriptional regulator [Paraburkholderia terrae]BCZ85600.1 TetR family transcriptional regulator [Paraburkholderia terrae]BDC45944.1 TetR family transcriptional regulator [Paraburkholderia terrae]